MSNQLAIMVDEWVEIEAYPTDEGAMCLVAYEGGIDSHRVIADLTKAQAAELGQYLLTWSQQP